MEIFKKTLLAASLLIPTLLFAEAIKIILIQVQLDFLSLKKI